MEKSKKEDSVLYAFIGEKGRGMCNTTMKVKPYKSDFMLIVERESRKQTLKDVLEKVNEEMLILEKGNANSEELACAWNHLNNLGKWLEKEIKKLGVEKNG